MDAYFDVMAKQAYSSKLGEAKLKYLSNFECLGAVNGSAGTKARVKCKFEDCGKVMTYFVSAGTTSNLLNHLRNIHKI